MENKIIIRGLSVLVITVMIATVFSIPVLKEDKVYAAAKKYQVTFKVNKGMFTDKKYANKKSFTKKIKKGKKIGTLPNVDKVGYTLKGWYTRSSGGKKVTKSTKINKKMTLYAQWKKVAKFKVDNSYLSILGSGYNTKENFEKAFPKLVYSNMDFTGSGESYHENTYYIDKSTGIKYTIEKYTETGTYMLISISIKAKYLVSTKTSYAYKTFMKAMDVPEAGYYLNEYKTGNIKHAEVFLFLNNAYWTIVVNPDTKKIDPDSLIYLNYAAG